MSITVTSLHGSPGNFGGTTAYTRAMAVKFNKRVKLISIGFYASSTYNGSTATVNGKVWNAGKGFIASGDSASGPAYHTTPLWSNFSSEIYLEADTLYYIGGYQSTATGYYSQSLQHDEATVDGVTMTSKYSDTNVYYMQGDTSSGFPTSSNTTSYEFPFALMVSADEPPSVSVVSPASGQKVNPREPLTVTWNYSDADADPQTDATVSWRVAGSGLAFTNYLVSGAGTSYIIPANTLPDDENIELMVRVANINAATDSSPIIFESNSWDSTRTEIPATQTFSYTGSAQEWTVPAGVNQVTVKLWGAEGGKGGGNGTTNLGPAGSGGYTTGKLSVTPGDIINIYVGGKGSNGIATSTGGTGGGAGGWNGGGKGGDSMGGGSDNTGGGGGGATDIRIGGTTESNRAAVAGGGGGGGGGSDSYAAGGAGGHGGGTGTAGTAGGYYSGYAGGSGGAAATQTGAAGGNGSQASGGAGAGYKGGSGGGSPASNASGGGGGGAGSGWAGSLELATTTNGGRTGHGAVEFTYTQVIEYEESSLQSAELLLPADTEPGTYELQVAAGDEGGIGAWSTSTTFEVIPFNTAPDAVITNIPTKVYNESPVSVEWLYSDNENDPQISYQFRVRRKV